MVLVEQVCRCGVETNTTSLLELHSRLTCTDGATFDEFSFISFNDVHLCGICDACRELRPGLKPISGGCRASRLSRSGVRIARTAIVLSSDLIHHALFNLLGFAEEVKARFA